MSRETGDAEVCFPDTAEWLPVFSWRKSHVSFNAYPFRESPHLQNIAANLVRSLGARIEDDEGNPVED